MENRKIKQICVDGQGYKYSNSEEGEIKEVLKNGEMASIIWYELGKVEYNSKFVVSVEYEN